MSFFSIVIFFIVIGILVTIHELGHYFVARLFKIKVYEVAIFVGPKLFEWNKNDISYTIRAIPLGAYVRFSDIDDEGKIVDSDDENFLLNQARWKRLLVALAGPIMNLLLGILILSTMNCILGYSVNELGRTYEGTQLYETDYTPGDKILRIDGEKVYGLSDFSYIFSNKRLDDSVTLTLKNKDTKEIYDIDLVPKIEEKYMLGFIYTIDSDNEYNGVYIQSVLPGQNDGHPVLKEGDYLVKVDDVEVTDENFADYCTNIDDNAEMTFTYYRNGKLRTDKSVKTKMIYTNERGIAVLCKKVNSFSSFCEACGEAIKTPLVILKMSCKVIHNAIIGVEKPYNVVSGPIGVSTVVSDIVDGDQEPTDKAITLLNMIALISISLTITNLLPIPGLDGIQIIYLVAEMIIGRKISKKTETVINIVGFVIIILLLIYALVSDVLRIIFER